MKFAFSTECCPEWDFPIIAGKARGFGCDGVEISGAAGPSDMPGRLSLDDPAADRQVLAVFRSASIDIACVAAPARLTGDQRADPTNAAALRRWIDLAADLDCPRVMLRDPEPRRGVSGLAAGAALAAWVAPIADHALTRGVTLVVCNDATLTSARLMWGMLERLRHPAVACCWDLYRAAQAGESPSVSVPTLNSQIRYARLGGMAAGSHAPAPREPESISDVQLFLTRLRGIGYGGYVTVAGPTGLAATVQSRPAESLPVESLSNPPAVSLSNPSSASQGQDESVRNTVAQLKTCGTPPQAAVSRRRKQETRPKAG